MPSLPPPRDLAAPIGVLVVELASHLGVAGTVARCVDLLGGDDPRRHREVLPYLTGLPAARTDHPAYWARTWGARGLLHLWQEDAAPAVVAGLGDPHWRPAEMCLKVAARRGVGEAGPGAELLLEHRLPRVRAQAVRALGLLGDTDHVAAVRAALDDDGPDVRRAAARALDRMTSRLDLPGH